MKRLSVVGTALAALLPAALGAQSSQFGIRALGYPNQPYSAHSRAL